MYRAALIGCGLIGSEFADDPLQQGDIYTHAEAYHCCASTKLVAVCDVDSVRLARCGQRWQVAARYGDVAELVETEKPDLVSVCTPDRTHFDVIRSILAARHQVQAIFCEKPLAGSVQEAQEILRLAKGPGILVAVGYVRRYAENLRNLRTFLKVGELGDLQAVDGWYTKGTLHNGSHWFDLVRYLAAEVDWVMATDTLRENGPDPTLDVALGLAGGTLATLRACDAQHFSVFEMSLMFTRGRVSLRDDCLHIEVFRSLPSKRYSGYFELQAEHQDFGVSRNMMLHAVEDLVMALQTCRPPACSAQDGLAALKIGCAAHESARTGQRVMLET